MKKIVKRIFQVIGLVLLLLLLVIIAARCIKAVRYKKLAENGINEDIYVTLGGQQQRILIRGMKKDNPVIIYLHGGPASPDTSYSDVFTNDLTEAYTVIAWDQRGCGRTYFANEAADPENETADFEQLQSDLNELVDYARARFGQEKVIVMGHSWGSVVGSVYAQQHPEKLIAYVGVGQVISAQDSEICSYEDALRQAKERGDNTEKMEAGYRKLLAEPSTQNTLALRKPVSKYHPSEPASNMLRLGWGIVTSPYTGWKDIAWYLKIIAGTDGFIDLNRQLYDYTMAFDLNRREMKYDVPVYFISGADDWTCPTELIEAYKDKITAPEVQFIKLEGTGHAPQYTMPEKFAEIVKQLLQ